MTDHELEPTFDTDVLDDPDATAPENLEPVPVLDGPGMPRAAAPSPLRSLVVLLVTAAVVLAGVWFVSRGKGAETTTVAAGSGSSAALRVGAAPPDFTATTTSGERVSLSSLKGHPVWLTFGATWCADCRVEAPDIQAAYDRTKGSGVVVLQVYTGEDAATVKDYVSRIGLTYPTVADARSTIADSYRVDGIPAQFFIDREGVLRATRTGSMSAPEMAAALAAIS